jgi:hypothetical protein
MKTNNISAEDRKLQGMDRQGAVSGTSNMGKVGWDLISEVPGFLLQFRHTVYLAFMYTYRRDPLS